MKNNYNVYPKTENDLNVAFLSEITKQLNEGNTVTINPDQWRDVLKQKTSEDEDEDDCQCPACRARRAITEHFKDKYTAEAIQQFMETGDMPDEVYDYFEDIIEDYMAEDIDKIVKVAFDDLPDEVYDYFEDIIEDYMAEDIDKIVKVAFDDLPKSNFIQINEFQHLPTIPRYETQPCVINVHITRAIPEGTCIILGAPTLVKMIDSKSPDYIILGNFDKTVLRNMRKSTESYRYNLAIAKKFKDRICKSGSSLGSILTDIL